MQDIQRMQLTLQRHLPGACVSKITTHVEVPADIAQQAGESLAAFIDMWADELYPGWLVTEYYLYKC